MCRAGNKMTARHGASIPTSGMIISLAYLRRPLMYCTYGTVPIYIHSRYGRSARRGRVSPTFAYRPLLVSNSYILYITSIYEVHHHITHSPSVGRLCTQRLSVADAGFDFADSESLCVDASPDNDTTYCRINGSVCLHHTLAYGA